MKKIHVQAAAPARRRRRAVELFSAETNFRAKVMPNPGRYSRKGRQARRWQHNQD